MGKASSAKKVARAARAGGKKSSDGKRKQWGFPIAIAVIVVLGLGAVTFARQSDQAAADTKNPPQANRDHWHASYGLYVCDHFVVDVADRGPDTLGIHTHQDGLIHIHPFLAGASGKQATLKKFFDQTGMKLTETSLQLPAAAPFKGRLYKSGETTCNGKPAIVQVAKWKSAIEASKGAKPTKVYTSDFNKIRFTEDFGAYTIAFAPKGAKIPPPPGAGDIMKNAQNDQGASPGSESQTQTLPTDAATVPPDSGGASTAPATSAPATSAPATSAPQK